MLLLFLSLFEIGRLPELNFLYQEKGKLACCESKVGEHKHSKTPNHHSSIFQCLGTEVCIVGSNLASPRSVLSSQHCWEQKIKIKKDNCFTTVQKSVSAFNNRFRHFSDHYFILNTPVHLMNPKLLCKALLSDCSRWRHSAFHGSEHLVNNV